MRKSFVGTNARRPAVERFFERLWFDMSECWLWAGATNNDGYGIFTAEGEILAHRASWALHNGPIPAGMCVMHSCDRPDCVNPEHLSLGTHADNMADMARKGNRKGVNVGERNGRAKLNPVDVAMIRELRKSGAKLSALADLFNVGVSSISRVCRGENWNV